VCSSTNLECGEGTTKNTRGATSDVATIIAYSRSSTLEGGAKETGCLKQLVPEKAFENRVIKLGCLAFARATSQRQCAGRLLQVPEVSISPKFETPC
jgi:hypothetical protein